MFNFVFSLCIIKPRRRPLYLLVSKNMVFLRVHKLSGEELFSGHFKSCARRLRTKAIKDILMRLLYVCVLTVTSCFWLYFECSFYWCRMQNDSYFARIAVTLSIRLWTTDLALNTYLIRIWLQVSIFIYVAWSAATILSHWHLLHLRNWLLAAAAANRFASSKLLEVTDMHHIDDGISIMVFYQLLWLAIGDGRLAMTIPVMKWSSSTYFCLCEVVLLSRLFVLLRRLVSFGPNIMRLWQAIWQLELVCSYKSCLSMGLFRTIPIIVRCISETKRSCSSARDDALHAVGESRPTHLLRQPDQCEFEKRVNSMMFEMSTTDARNKCYMMLRDIKLYSKIPCMPEEWLRAFVHGLLCDFC